VRSALWCSTSDGRSLSGSTPRGGALAPRKLALDRFQSLDLYALPFLRRRFWLVVCASQAGAATRSHALADRHGTFAPGARERVDAASELTPEFVQVGRHRIVVIVGGRSALPFRLRPGCYRPLRGVIREFFRSRVSPRTPRAWCRSLTKAQSYPRA
jgi:hypothetical protein